MTDVPGKLGPYKIEGVLGQGGVATVYRASRDFTRPAALKVLNPEAARDPHVRRAFQREFRNTSRLRHPGIIRAYNFGEFNGQFYIAVEMIEGITLEEFLLRHKKISEDAAVDIARQLAAALEHVHEQGIVHRDIKTSNILMTQRRRPILFDFGAALDLDADDDTEPGRLYGTPAFISPEQARGDRDIDGRSDLYSLGIVLYRMVSGQKPFYGTRNDVLHAQIFEEPSNPSQHAHVSPDLEAIILKLMEKDPDDRYQSAAELIAALDSVDLEPEKPILD